MIKNAVVIVAAGRGERLGIEGGPKQYRKIGSSSLLQHTLDCFSSHPEIHLIQVVIHKDDFPLYSKSTQPNEKLLEPVIGGVNRQASCRAGVEALDGRDIDKVLIHDAARPFVSASLISRILSGISKSTCALPCTPVADTIKRSGAGGFVVETVPRSSLYLAQTPQGFFLDEIVQAHQKAVDDTNEEFTDDAAVAEWFGMAVKIVEGDRDNFKVTTQQDLIAASEKLMNNMQIADVRTGSGYDVHVLGDGDGVILCGVEIPHDQALQGHSDADVGLHSLTDALLGTIGAGDIGHHFPPSDPKWKGASSDQFLEHAVMLVKEAGGLITNLDVTIICEAPKIGPHRDKMRKRVSEICDLEDFRVSVKATTNEKIGFIGRQEGIAAIATATVSFRTVSHV